LGVTGCVCEDRVLDGPALEDKGPYALAPNTLTPLPRIVEPITTLGGLRGGGRTHLAGRGEAEREAPPDVRKLLTDAEA